MKITFKRWLPLTGFIGCAYFGMLSAANQMNCPTECPPQCPPKPCAPCEPNPCCPQTPAYGYDVPCNFAITHNAGPRVCEGVDLFVTVDFIWWTARQDGLGYAITGINATTSADVSGKGHVQQPDWKWKPGFKVGAGANLWHDGWDIYAQYTWFHTTGDTKNTETDSKNETNQLVGTWIVGGLVQSNNSNLYFPLAETLSKASGRWDVHMNVVDVELGRNYFVSRFLTLRPFFGLKGMWQHQDYKVRYTITNTNPASTNAYSMRQHPHMWGIGIRTGVNTAWHFTREWSIFGDWAITALMEKFDINRKDRFSSTSTGSSPIDITSAFYEDGFYSLKGVLELAIGLRWDIWFGCNDTFHFRLQAAWEEQLWWNQNQFIGRLDQPDHGDLMFHGLTVKARFDF